MRCNINDVYGAKLYHPLQEPLSPVTNQFKMCNNRMRNMRTEASVYIRRGITFSVRTSALSAAFSIFRSTQQALTVFQRTVSPSFLILVRAFKSVPLARSFFVLITNSTPFIHIRRRYPYFEHRCYSFRRSLKISRRDTF